MRQFLFRWRVGPLRTLTETLTIFCLLLASLESLDLPPRILMQGVVFLCLGCALMGALRLRLANSLRKLVPDVTVALVLGVVSAALTTEVLLEIGLFALRYRVFAIFIVFSIGIAFLVFRVGVYFWRFWNRLRREHLIWSLTHAHLVVAAVIPSLIFALFAVGFPNSFIMEKLVNSPEVQPASKIAMLVIGVLPMMSMAVIFIFMGLAVLLPPSAIFSYFVTRRTTRRLETLASATKAVRDKDYTVRVDVKGQDEVAHLQSDFNAMTTDLEKAMNDLRTERDTVTRLLQTRRDLAANVSHELRTPVATLRASLESAIEHNLPPSIHDLEVMEQDVRRLQTLIDDLFTLSRAEIGQLTLRCQPTNVCDVIHRLVDSGASLAWRSSRIEIIAQLPSELPLAEVDAGRLEQILQNLLHNSLRHTPSGGVITISALAEDKSIVVEVWDSGEGITAEELPHIWERFYRGSRTREQDSSGTGIGLALVKELIEAMHGSVTAESTPGEGSRFILRLPRSAEQDCDIAQPKRDKPPLLVRQ